MDRPLIPLNRRELLAALGGSAFALGIARGSAAKADDASARIHDWDWLVGNWDVWHRRLKDRLVGSTQWEEFSGKSAFWITMGGLGNVDDNSLDLPGGTYRGLSVRAFDPATGKWAIWWLDGRNPTYIEPPVLGGFDERSGTFVGRDTLRGRPILMRFRWNDIHSVRPWWEQAFSPDDGKNWEVNWRNYFTRTAPNATSLPKLRDARNDWDFLAGSWTVKHRRLQRRFVGYTRWVEFDGTLKNWFVLGGHGNVGDNVMEFPDATVRGMGLRAFDPARNEWLSWWLDSRSPSTIGPPLRGTFTNGVGTFIGDDTFEGRAIKTRVIWSHITPRSARWEQSSSNDDGRTWETNWTSEFTRST